MTRVRASVTVLLEKLFAVLLYVTLTRASVYEEPATCDGRNSTCSEVQQLGRDQLLMQVERSHIMVHTQQELRPKRASKKACKADKVSRRRRDRDMCSCRRRNGPRDGWTCSGDTVVEDESYVPPPSLPPAEGSSDGSVKVMSYNVMGWSACGRRRRRNLPGRGIEITNKIKYWDPAVLGAQEVETGGGSGGADCEAALVANTELDGGLYKKSILQRLEPGSSWTKLVGGYWMAGARYKHIKSGNEFLLFNSHWKHGYGMEQAKIAASAIDEERKKYGSPPTLFMGDTNQFCKGYDSDAYKYLTGQIGSSPVKFADVHAGDWGGSFGNGDCRVDFIFASGGQWSLVDAVIDRNGMNGGASDHAALIADLLPMVSGEGLPQTGSLPPIGSPIGSPPPCQTIAELAIATPELSTLLSLVRAADPSILELLSDSTQTLTVFAPNNAAFAAVEGLDVVIADQPLLTSLLSKHALGSVVMASAALTLENAAVTTLAEENITVDGSTGSVLVTPTIVGGPSTVVSADIEACNGVVHVVDKVIRLSSQLPPPPVPMSAPTASVRTSPSCCGTSAPFYSIRSRKCYPTKAKWYYLKCDTISQILSAGASPSCCDTSTPFYSIRSRKCYPTKAKWYYKKCDAISQTPPTEASPSCCGSSTPFYSPRSRNCYPAKAKRYYKKCDAVSQTPSTVASPSCCGSSTPFYSPRSRNCYSTKAKKYYKSCKIPPYSCCNNCKDMPFCSPRSRQCYATKKKNYYENCSSPELAEAVRTRSYVQQ